MNNLTVLVLVNEERLKQEKRRIAFDAKLNLRCWLYTHEDVHQKTEQEQNIKANAVEVLESHVLKGERLVTFWSCDTCWLC